MTIDLMTMSRAELEILQTDVAKALKLALEKEKLSALKAAEDAVAAFGFSLADITGGAGRKTNGVKSLSAPKYRNPDNAGQSWTGRGRQPAWFKAALANGQTPDAVEI